MTCPKCGGSMQCPCRNCVARRPEPVVTWLWDGDDNMSCGHCGHTMHACAWQDEFMRQYEAQQESGSTQGGGT